MASPDQRAAADALWAAGAAVLEAGVDGAGAVTQSALLRAAHTARLRQLPRAAGAALSVVTLLRAARAGDPSYRTADLVTALAELLGTAHRVRTASGPELAAVRGRARRPYSPDGSLRLYGLFTEPVVTDSGHGGVRTWVAGSDGRLFTVGDVAPGGVGRALGVADRAVRLGDSALTHRELGRAGLAVAGATVSPDGRLGAGKGVKAVTARGAAWTEPPLAALWETPPSEQATRALRSVSRYADPDGGGSDLLFLDVELLGAVWESGGSCLLARCAGGVHVRLTVADDDPALAHRDNVALLATAPGTRLRIIGRLVPAPTPGSPSSPVRTPPARARWTSASTACAAPTSRTRPPPCTLPRPGPEGPVRTHPCTSWSVGSNRRSRRAAPLSACSATSPPRPAGSAAPVYPRPPDSSPPCAPRRPDAIAITSAACSPPTPTASPPTGWQPPVTRPPWPSPCARRPGNRRRRAPDRRWPSRPSLLTKSEPPHGIMQA